MDQEVEVRRFRLALAPEYVRMTHAGQALTGIGAGAQAQVGVTRHFGWGGSLRQTFSSDELFTAFLTQFDVKAIYSFPGSLLRTREVTRSESGSIAVSESRESPGFQVEASLNQYLFNTSNGIVSLTGPGIGAQYAFSPGRSDQQLFVGLKLDNVSNGSIDISPFRFIAGILIGL